MSGRTGDSLAAAPRRRRGAGFTLVELVLVCGLAATLLAGAWGWAWTVADAGGRIGDGAEVATSLAYLRRMLLSDARAAYGLDEASACSPATLTLAVPTEHHQAGRVTITWNRDRGVLWRVAPSCHLADGVESFGVSYFDAEGVPVAEGSAELLAAEKRQVAGIVVHVRLRYGRASREGSWPVWFGGQKP